MQISRLATDCLAHLALVRRVSPNTIDNYDRTYRQFIAYVLHHGGEDDVRSFKDERAKGFCDDLLERQIKPSTVRNKLSALSTLAEFAMKMKDARRKPYLPHNPMK